MVYMDLSMMTYLPPVDRKKYIPEVQIVDQVKFSEIIDEFFYLI